MRITELWTYPIKGCRGIRLDAATLSTTGIVNDRAWMIVDRSGMFITQRGDPKIARIEVSFSGHDMTLAADGSSITLATAASGELRQVRVWRHTGMADDAGDDVAAWLTSYIGSNCRLVRTGRVWDRSVVTHDLPRLVSFADGYPFLVVSEASLADLNTRVPAPVPMTRFRGNIIVDGVAAYAEDAIDTATCGNVVIRSSKPCTRCAVTTIDQVSGARDQTSEPLRTLARYRHSREWKGVLFGMNYVLDSGVGETLRVGDEFTTVYKANTAEAV